MYIFFQVKLLVALAPTVFLRHHRSPVLLIVPFKNQIAVSRYFYNNQVVYFLTAYIATTFGTSVAYMHRRKVHMKIVFDTINKEM